MVLGVLLFWVSFRVVAALKNRRSRSDGRKQERLAVCTLIIIVRSCSTSPVKSPQDEVLNPNLILNLHFTAQEIAPSFEIHAVNSRQAANQHSAGSVVADLFSGAGLL